MTNENRPTPGLHLGKWVWLEFLAMAFFLTTGAMGAPAQPASPPSAALKHGEAIFHSRCIVCHNKKPGDTSPFGPPNLYHVFGAKPPVLTAAQAEQIITHGKGQMPAFGGALTKADMRDVIDYLRSQGQRKP